MTWKEIPGYDGYLVSNTGLVRSVDRIVKYKDGKNFPHKGRLLKLVNHHTGYVIVSVKGKSLFVHRLVALAFIDNPKYYSIVNHIDGDKKNSNSNNLEWCTREHNEKHAKINGLKYRAKGELNAAAKLTSVQINEIRELIGTGIVLRRIAEKYNVSYPTITNIKRGKSWLSV